MQQQEIIKHVTECVHELAHIFNRFTGRFGPFQSEGDLRAYLYYLISKNPFFLNIFDYKGEEGVFKNIYLHAEYSTFCRVKKSIGHLDLAIIDPDEKSPFDTLIGIEIKWRDSLQNSKDLLEIRQDLLKLSNPKNEISYPILLLFSRKKYPYTLTLRVPPNKKNCTVYQINPEVGIRQI